MDSIRSFGQYNSLNVLNNKNKKNHNLNYISENSDNNSGSSANFDKNKFLQKNMAEYLKKTANNDAKNNKLKAAIHLYNLSINEQNNDPETYYYLAKAYKDTGDNKSAIKTYNKLLTIAPDDKEALTLIGECHKDIGDYKNARNYYQKCITLDPKYDFAVRSLKELDLLEMSKKNPKEAKQTRQNLAYNNLKKSLYLVKDNAPKELTQALKGINFNFDTTNTLSGHANIAQYEFDKNRIVVNDKYALAAPEVVASYLVHEAVHAKDRDPYTSIREEQDAYRAAVKFWIKNNHGVKDPEMDYASELYNQSPSKLNNKVKEIYSARDSEISETSPYHELMAKSLGARSFDVKFNNFSNIYKPFFPQSCQGNVKQNPEKLMLLDYMG